MKANVMDEIYWVLVFRYLFGRLPFKIKGPIKRFNDGHTKVNGNFQNIDGFQPFVQPLHQSPELLGCSCSFVMIAAAACRHQVGQRMYVNLKPVFVKFCFALRVVMINLHLFVLHAGAAIGATSAKLLIHLFPYTFTQRHF